MRLNFDVGVMRFLYRRGRGEEGWQSRAEQSGEMMVEVMILRC